MQPTADGNGNAVPDYVDLALATMTDVHDTYVAAGYRAPKSDSTADGGGTDESPTSTSPTSATTASTATAPPTRTSANRPQDTWGYCVLDNDYRPTSSRPNTPMENLQVTAAHEYFHAVQFGYDVAEDGWVMEATATWAEDELYDGVNDNVQYLRSGPMSLPHKSLDQFFGELPLRRLDLLPLPDRAVPGVRRAGCRPWSASCGAGSTPRPAAAGEYSLEGVKGVLRKRDLSLTEAFAGFSAANRTPGRSYAEGKANRYPPRRWPGRRRSSQAVPGARPAAAPLDHLAAGTVRYTPAKSLVSPKWRLALTARHGRPLEGHRRGGHDPAAPRGAEDQVGHPRQATATPRRSTSSRPRR